jgi:hypothetical protein
MFIPQYDPNLTYGFEYELPYRVEVSSLNLIFFFFFVVLPPRGTDVILASFIRK